MLNWTEKMHWEIIFLTLDRPKIHHLKSFLRMIPWKNSKNWPLSLDGMHFDCFAPFWTFYRLVSAQKNSKPVLLWKMEPAIHTKFNLTIWVVDFLSKYWAIVNSKNATKTNVSHPSIQISIAFTYDTLLLIQNS